VQGQIVVLSQGCLDAIVLSRFESRREEGKQSKPWMERQGRKIDGAMRAFNDIVSSRVNDGKEYLVVSRTSLHPLFDFTQDAMLTVAQREMR
jgi:hypothetical protein